MSVFALGRTQLYLYLDVDFSSKACATSNQLLFENLFRSPESNIVNLLAASCISTCFKRPVKTDDVGPLYVWKRTKQPGWDCLSL